MENNLTELETEALNAIIDGVCEFGNLDRDELNEDTIRLTEASDPYGACYRGDEKVFRALATSLQKKGYIEIQTYDPECTWIQLRPQTLAFLGV